MSDTTIVTVALVAALCLALAINKSNKSNSLPKQEARVTRELTNKVPQTEEEVMQALQYDSDITTNAMRGIASVRIKMGDTPVQAYEYALLQLISVFKAQGESNESAK